MRCQTVQSSRFRKPYFLRTTYSTGVIVAGHGISSAKVCDDYPKHRTLEAGSGSIGVMLGRTAVTWQLNHHVHVRFA
jgi:hypothetical protein